MTFTQNTRNTSAPTYENRTAVASISQDSRTNNGLTWAEDLNTWAAELRTWEDTAGVNLNDRN